MKKLNRIKNPAKVQIWYSAEAKLPQYLKKEVLGDKNIKVFKNSLIKGEIGKDYAEEVNKRASLVDRIKMFLGIKPKFKPESTYATPVPGSKIFYRKKDSGQLYIRVYVESGMTIGYYAEIDGKKVNLSEEVKNSFDKYFSERKRKASESAKKHQGIDNPVKVINLIPEKIVSISEGSKILNPIVPYEEILWDFFQQTKKLPIPLDQKYKRNYYSKKLKIKENEEV